MATETETGNENENENENENLFFPSEFFLKTPPTQKEANTIYNLHLSFLNVAHEQRLEIFKIEHEYYEAAVAAVLWESVGYKPRFEYVKEGELILFIERFSRKDEQQQLELFLSLDPRYALSDDGKALVRTPRSDGLVPGFRFNPNFTARWGRWSYRIRDNPQSRWMNKLPLSTTVRPTTGEGDRMSILVYLMGELFFEQAFNESTTFMKYVRFAWSCKIRDDISNCRLDWPARPHLPSFTCAAHVPLCILRVLRKGSPMQTADATHYLTYLRSAQGSVTTAAEVKNYLQDQLESKPRDAEYDVIEKVHKDVMPRCEGCYALEKKDMCPFASSAPPQDIEDLIQTHFPAKASAIIPLYHQVCTDTLNKRNKREVGDGTLPPTGKCSSMRRVLAFTFGETLRNAKMWPKDPVLYSKEFFYK